MTSLPHQLLLQQRYAAVLTCVTIIISILFQSSNAYVMRSPSFVTSNPKSPMQHDPTLCLEQATLLSPSKFSLQLSYSAFSTSIRLAVTNGNNDMVKEEDNGWETGTKLSNPADKQQPLSPDSSSPLKTESLSQSPLSPEQELESLRTQVSNKRNVKLDQSPSYFATDDRNTRAGGGFTNKEQKRDLFIPIVSVLSLAGLFGAYGYEMLRLNLNGELYLPWNQ